MNFIVSRVIASYSKFKSYPDVRFKSCCSYSKKWSNLSKKDIGHTEFCWLLIVIAQNLYNMAIVFGVTALFL